MDLRDGRLLVGSVDSFTTQIGSVFLVDLATGMTRALATDRLSPLNVAIGPTHAYWSERDSNATTGHGPIVRAPLDGSGTVEEVLPVEVSGFQMLADDDGTLYFQNGFLGIASLARGASSATDLVTGVAALYFASDREHLYWTDCVAGAVARVAKGGGQEQLLVDAFCPTTIATDGGDLYYTAGTPPSMLYHVPAEGGAEAVVSGAAPSTNLALDEHSLYFGDAQGLRRLARSDRTVATLVAGEVSNVAVDDACVYWTDTAALTVFTLPK